ncbi:MAG: hypothetical protein ACRD3C_02915 [Vicinamibacterales bacterium]
MNQRTRDNDIALPTWDPLLTFAVIAGLSLVFWLLVRKRGAPTALLSPIAVPTPLVSPWSPLP